MMLVRCPACQTTFRARPEHLAARNGRVRCGHCFTAFNALQHLVEPPESDESPEPTPAASVTSDTSAPREPPQGFPAAGTPVAEASESHAVAQTSSRPFMPEADIEGSVDDSEATRDTTPAPTPEGVERETAQIEHDLDGRPTEASDPPRVSPEIAWKPSEKLEPMAIPVRSRADYSYAARGHGSERHEPLAEPIAFAANPDAEDDTADFAPDLTRYARREPVGRSGLWALMVGILLGSLAVQSAYIFRVELSRHWPQLRPVMVTLCERLTCDMPLPRNAQAINVTSSHLESDPAIPSRFVLHARVRNEAAYRQAHPHLELTLTDVRDRPLARRVIEPSEWVSPEAVSDGLVGRSEIELQLPFTAPELTQATGYRLYAFFP